MICNLLTIVYFVHIRLLVDMQTNCNYFAVAKTCQKPYAKTPQKLPKNPLTKNSPKTPQKSFMKILTQKPKKYTKTS